jgi:hypothetical protein
VYSTILAASGSDTNPTSPIQTAGQNLLQGLIDLDVLDYLDLIYVFGTDGDQVFATWNWLNPAVFQASRQNSPGFAAGGFNSNGSTSYIKTGYIPNRDAVQFRQNDCGWIMAGNMPNDASVSFGVLESGVSGIDAQITSTFFAGRLNSTTQATFTSSDRRGNKVWAATRINATQVEGWVDGVSLGTQTLNSTSLPNFELYLLCRNSAGTAANFNNSGNKMNIFMLGRGTKIRDNMAAIKALIDTYKTAMGI